jgi:hypothetical protein
MAATATPPPTTTPTVATASGIGVDAALPPNDPIEVAARYARTIGRAPASKPFAGEANVGESRDFIVLRISSASLEHIAPPEVATITATLQAKTAHAYFYEDDALGTDPADTQAAADLFESTIWPTVTGVFGEPLIPGVDGDPRIIVLQADLGGGVGGLFMPDDGYVKAVAPLSNEAEMVYMDRTLKPGRAGFNVVLAHEFQHLIHDKNDPHEEAWVNEGLSEDSSMLVGGVPGTLKAFAANPETQLNLWDSAGSTPHYGAPAAFFRYLASRFGGDASLGTLAREPRHGTAGIDQFLSSLGQPLRFREVFADWIAANLLNRDAGPYGNPAQPLDMSIEYSLDAGDPTDAHAHQFGTDYYSLSSLDGSEYVVAFHGQTQVPVLPQAALDFGPVLWSNAEDSIDTRLTRDLDLTAAAAPVLTFKTWFDIERWYDWGYVSASADGGATWQALAGVQTTTDDPVRVALGPGYSYKSGGADEAGWVDERISLAAYAGKRIKLRFEYLTDSGSHGEGWAIRDVAIAGTGFRDVDMTDAGWTSEGWLRIDRPLAQTYAVRVIASKANGDAVVLDVPVDATGAGVLRFTSAGLQDAVLAVAGTTIGTNQLAPYRVQLTRP